jgi:KDO2-lipid IV(A) lauroyltransferase
VREQPSNTAESLIPLPLWVDLASRLPLGLLYAVLTSLAWLVRVVFRLRLSVVRGNVEACFPDLQRPEVDALVAAHYRQVGEVVAEVLKGARLTSADLLDRVRLKNLDLARSLLDGGTPVLLLAAHQANWEWVLQVLAQQLGYPLDVAYKPIRSAWLDRAMFAIRTRAGARLIPARDELVMDILNRRHIVRGIAMLADQSPVSADQMLWQPFLGRETAFYLGAEKLARAMRYPVLFVALRRVSRGRYEITFHPLAGRGEDLAPGQLTGRYARLVEAEVRASPADWTWGHRRWKARKNLYVASGTR